MLLPFPEAIPAAHQGLVVRLHETLVSPFPESSVVLALGALVLEHTRFADLLWTNRFLEAILIFRAFPLSLPLELSRASLFRFFLREHAVRVGGKRWT